MKFIKSLCAWLFGLHGSHGGDVPVEVPPDNSHAAHLVKDPNPLAQATFHEEEPQLEDHVMADNLPHLVRNRGPLTKKVVATGNNFPGLEFSMVAWKFADGSIEGTMEEKVVESGAILVKVQVDCLHVQDGRAIVGGSIFVGGDNKNPSQLQRAYVVVLDSDPHQEVSNFLVHLPDETTCANLADIMDYTPMTETRNVMVCNRRDGEEAWLNCVKRNSKRPQLLVEAVI